MNGPAVNAHSEMHMGADRLVHHKLAQKAHDLALGLLFLFTALFAVLTDGGPVERLAQIFSDSVNSKPASGKIHLVEIDAKSLQELDRWPWPRSYHAKIVDALMAAGAEQVVFDVDFSSRSDANQDAIFADAIKRSGGKVVLPTFRQAASSRSAKADIEILPFDIFRTHAFLGAVNVRTDQNGHVNEYPFGVVTKGIARPSIAALLADASGALNSQFKIDQSIEPDSIPRHSFADVVAGRFEQGAFVGKKVIVGATAIELGDRYATNRFGVIPGVLIQAMAAETLIADMALPNLGPWPMMVCAFLLLLYYTKNFQNRRALGSSYLALAVIVLFTMPMLAERFRIAHLSVTPALMMIAVFLAAQYVIWMKQNLSSEQRFDRHTGLPNLHSWQEQSQSFEHSSVIVAEISNFEEILSTLQQSEVTQFVRAVAHRLSLVAGDQQMFHIRRAKFAWNAGDLSKSRIDEALDGGARLFNAPLLVGDRSIRATISFGVAVDGTKDAVSLLNRAILAAKSGSDVGVSVTWHDEGLAASTDLRLFVVSELEEALISGQVTVLFQPKYDLKQERICGAEALARWTHPEKGPVSPAVFVPILEQEGLMEAFTLFVIRKTLDEVKRWNIFSKEMTCSINISAALLTKPDFVERALAIISNSKVHPKHIIIELTETAALQSLDQAASALDRFKKLGAKLSIDDYGTGQSTLSYLKSFAADEIKIDQMFVAAMAGDKASHIMVRSTIEMANAMGMKVVAEGVEDENTMNILRDMGCDVIQGWFIGKPMSSREFVDNWCGIDDSEPGLKRAMASV